MHTPARMHPRTHRRKKTRENVSNNTQIGRSKMSFDVAIISPIMLKARASMCTVMKPVNLVFGHTVNLVIGHIAYRTYWLAEQEVWVHHNCYTAESHQGCCQMFESQGETLISDSQQSKKCTKKI